MSSRWPGGQGTLVSNLPPISENRRPKNSLPKVIRVKWAGIVNCRVTGSASSPADLPT